MVDGGYFNWLGYLVNGYNTASEVPEENLSSGTSPNFSWYYTFDSAVAWEFQPFPFASESYTHLGSALTIDQLDCSTLQ